MEPEDVNILVVGDIMLDKYIIGEVERISPEAPVPIVKVNEEYSTLGGCGNVVRNLRKIGAKTTCLSSVGIDKDGDEVIKQLENIGVKSLIIREEKPTTVKQRIIASERKVQMLRIDYEEQHLTPPSSVIYSLSKYLDKVDIILISDYAKGFISEDLIKFLKTLGPKIIVDPKPNHGYMYNNVYMITPNEKEWELMKVSSSYVLNNIRYVLITKGKKGMELLDYDKNWLIEAEPVEVYNVSGAGDTVIAVMGVCIAMGFPALRASKIANKCAEYVVTKPGTTAVPREVFDIVLQCVT